MRVGLDHHGHADQPAMGAVPAPRLFGERRQRLVEGDAIGGVGGRASRATIGPRRVAGQRQCHLDGAVFLLGQLEAAGARQAVDEHLAEVRANKLGFIDEAVITGVNVLRSAANRYT